MHAQKQAGFKMQLQFSAQYKCTENTTNIGNTLTYNINRMYD